MPKQKTHKGSAKRMKVTANGKVLRKKTFGGHLMSGKSGSQCRKTRKTVALAKPDAKRALRRLGQP
ncbi:MAG: 50S ribosomal protein L35 [Phycisphaerae bacterium]|nr:50S ribosomal protein L35 [Phycisphaerae bacterium]